MHETIQKNMLKTHKPKFLENTTRSTVETILFKKQQDGRQRVINGVWNMVNQQRTKQKKRSSSNYIFKKKTTIQESHPHCNVQNITFFDLHLCHRRLTGRN